MCRLPDRAQTNGGSDRIEITWPDNPIQKEWLEVIVNADTNTGLGAPRQDSQPIGVDD
jgi:hypothetical protein